MLSNKLQLPLPSFLAIFSIQLTRIPTQGNTCSAPAGGMIRVIFVGLMKCERTTVKL